VHRLGLLVTDASPLITLAAGEALECLTMPGLPVIVPDNATARAMLRKRLRGRPDGQG